MAEARTRSLRIRSRAAGLFAVGYVLALATFWIAGIVVFAVTESGVLRLAGLAYFPILGLPFASGQSDVWFWLFGLQMVLGAGAMWMYPYEPRRHRRPRRPKALAPRPAAPRPAAPTPATATAVPRSRAAVRMRRI